MMFKLKKKSSAKKRFKLNSNGLIKRKHAFKNHLLTKKSTKRKRNLVHFTTLDKANKKNIKRQLLI
ncbi:50S ribosomal subunit protein L35 [Candidatus Uzinura diaspidicola str. ASNER]|uniref:Large ribosomal subunit protein bL35 n=1 Tax=Candidatus Uzinura diaspidicola str. ASNER TaxID=1133592 RepID=L7VN10_9FLAO|nr:50S ribosomal subunit protein L35 [Candidatus Uzinura diaspidicola str. ASNER]